MWKIVALTLAALIVGAATPAATPLKKDKDSSADNNPGGGTGPKIVLIIRHGEKPTNHDDPNLSAVGYQRADALAKVIPAHFPRPDDLFATKKSAKSVRPIETLTPLSKALDEPINEDFSEDQVEDLAKDVLTNPKYNDKVVLIAWHHGKIPDLAKALGAKDAPKEWSSSVFDRVWELTYSGGAVHLANLPENALPGDSK